jgi:hypothetical protein
MFDKANAHGTVNTCQFMSFTLDRANFTEERPLIFKNTREEQQPTAYSHVTIAVHEPAQIAPTL